MLRLEPPFQLLVAPLITPHRIVRRLVGGHVSFGGGRVSFGGGHVSFGGSGVSFGGGGRHLLLW